MALKPRFATLGNPVSRFKRVEGWGRIHPPGFYCAFTGADTGSVGRVIAESDASVQFLAPSVAAQPIRYLDGSVKFDGVYDRLLYTLPTPHTGSFSLFFRVAFLSTSLGQYKAIFSSTQSGPTSLNFQIDSDGAGNLRFLSYGSDYVTIGPLSLTYRSYAVVYDGSSRTVTTYYEGKPYASKVFPTGFTAYTDVIALGTNRYANYFIPVKYKAIYYVPGQLLPSAEIRALHADPYAPIRKRRVLVPVASGGSTTPTRTVSLQAVLSKTQTAATSLTLAVAKARAFSAQLDSVLQALKTLTTSADAAVSKNLQAQTNLEAAVSKNLQAQTNLEAALSKTLQAQTSLDINIVASATSKLVSLDLAIKRLGNQLQSSLDLGVQVSQSQLAQLDVLIGQANSQLASLDLALKKSLNLTSQLSLAVQSSISATASLDVNIIQGLLAKLDMACQRVRQATTQLDVYIGEATSIIFHPQVETPEITVYTPTIGKPVY